VQRSGSAQGSVYGELLETTETAALPKAELRISWLYALTNKINTTPSLYLEAGAIHGCVLCEADRPLVYMEDVGRHNAVDKIAGYMHMNRISPVGKIFYTTGRLTSEMVIKTVQMGIPILVSRSGFTAWGVELARQAGLTLIDRLRPQVDQLVLNANGDHLRFAGFGLPVVADSIPDFAGPLAGILAGLDWAADNRPDCPLVVSVATDAPFLPEDLVARLIDD